MAHLTKRKSGGNYYVRYKDNLGRDQWISTRSKRLGGEDGANAFFEDWLKNRNKYNTSNILLSELINEVLKFIKLNLPRSYDNYKECLYKFLKITQDKPVKLVNNQDIEFYKKSRSQINNKGKTLSPHTINKEVRTIKSAFNKATQELRLINENSLSKAAQIRVTISKKRKRFTAEEKSKIFENITNPALFRIATIARYTGMRLSEILFLQVKDVDFHNSRITISNKPDIGFYTKSGEERQININNKLLEYFQLWLDIDTNNNIRTLINPERFITYYDNNKNYTKSYISRKFKLVLTKLNIDGYFHCLRHTFASELIESGEVDILTLRDLLGHTNIKTTSIYLQSLDENKQKAVQKAI